MSTLEKFFVQIFDRKNGIVDQLKQQRDLYDQYLTSTLLIKGIQPPSWLWSAGCEAGSADLKELKEELISGLLFPPPRPKIPSSIGHDTLYNRPVVTANNGQFSFDVFSETCASSKYFDLGDKSTVLPKCHLNNSEIDLGCTLKVVPEQDHTITSPRGETDARTSDICFEQGQSLARIQRSRSRQNALELRNSGKAKAKRCQGKKNCSSFYTGRITRSRTSSEQPNHVKELLELDNSNISSEGGSRVTRSRSAPEQLNSVDKSLQPLQPLNCVEEDADLQNALATQVTVQRSSSGKKDLELWNCVETNTERHPCKGDIIDECSRRNTRSRTTHQQFNYAEGLLEPNNSSKIPSARVTRSRSASINKSSQLAKPCNWIEGHDLKKATDPQVTTMQCNDISDFVDQETYTAGIAESELVSNLPVEANTTHSGSNMIGASRGGGLELLVPGAHSDSSIFVEPKQLVFDDVEDFSLNETFSPASEKEKRDGSPEMRSTLLGPTESLNKVTISDDLHEKHCLPVNEQFVEKDQTMEAVNREEEWRDSSEAHEERIDFFGTDKSERDFCYTSANKNSNLSAPSSRKRPSEIYEDIVPDTCSGSKKISKQALIESLKKVTISNDVYENCGLSVDEQLLEKDQIMEVAKQVEEWKASFEVYEEERLESVGKDKSEHDFYPISSAGKTSNSDLSPGKGPSETYEDVVADTSPESNKISKRVHIESLKKVTISHDIREKNDSLVDVELVERDQTVDVLSSEEEWRESAEAYEERRLKFVETKKSECHFYPASSTGKPSNVSPRSSRKGKSEIYENLVPDTSPVSHRISEQAPAPSSNLISLQVGRKSSLASQLQGAVGINLLDVDMDGKYTGKLDVLTKILPEDFTLEINGCDGPKKSICLDFNDVTDCSLLKNPDMLLGVQETESSYAVATNAATRSVLRQTETPDTAQIHNEGGEARYFLRSYTSHDKNVGCSKSNGSHFAKKSIQLTKTINNSWENSWPQHKRRKIEGRSSNVVTTSPRFRRVRSLQLIHEENTCRYLKSAEDVLGAVLEFQHFPISCEEEVARSNVIENPGVEMHWSEKRPKTERSESSPKFQNKEGELELERGDQDANIPLGLTQTRVEASLNPSVNKGAHGDSQGCLKDKVGMADPISIVHDVKWPCASEEHNLLRLESKLNLGSMENLSSTEGTVHGWNSILEERLFSHCSVGSRHYEDLDLIGADQAMPEFEGFSIGVPTENLLPCIAGDRIGFDESDLPSSTRERISVLEQLCRSTSMLTPLPPPSKYKLHTTPDIYQSLPNGLLECMDLRKTVLFNDGDIKQLKASYSCMGAEVDGTFSGRSYSDCLPSSSGQFDWDVRRPYTPPVGKLCQRITSMSTDHSSEKQQSVNPELTCFRIDEDTITSEENGNLDEALDPSEEGVSPREKHSSTNREPLVDMTNINPPASVSAAEKFRDSGSLDFLNTEFSFHGTQMDAKHKLRNCYGIDKRYMNKDKETQSSTTSENGIEKANESLHNRFSRPKLSGKASDKKETRSFLDKGSKRTNIVSNISSFIPLVQQKQHPVAVFTGKRDIKVKSLEAADTARRLEERRENDRKMKKEAAKLERARLVQEKMRQLELKQKKKEEERKKKEADMAARKRLREEEERKEKARKRKCIEEARRQQKEQEENLRVKKEEKELRSRVADERECKKKVLPDEERKHHKTERGREGAECRERMEAEPRIPEVSAGDARKASDFHEDFEAFKESHDIEKVVNDSGKANEGGISVTEGSQEQSYEISPYQGSDDEEEEEDNIPNRKFIPSWAREKRLASILPSLQQIDPYEIFHPASFCSIAEVLLHRKQHLK